MASKPTYIGTLDRRICIETPTSSRGTSGQELLTWATFAECWAGVEYPGTKSDEGVIADQEVSVTTVNFIIRYRDGLNQKMRIVYNGENYDILNKFELGRREFLKLPAKLHE